MLFPILQELEQKGHLKVLVNKGVVSTTSLFHYEIYLEYDKRKQTTKRNKTAIVFELTELFKVSEKTVYTALRKFK